MKRTTRMSPELQKNFIKIAKTVDARRPFDEARWASFYRESDADYVMNNIDEATKLLDLALMVRK